MSNILIVEDDLTLQEAYTFILKSDGHDVQSAFNGKEALEIVKHTSFDLILLDLHMPIMDGWAFLESYQPHRSLKTIVILFSNMVESDTGAEAEAYGVSQTILKSTMTPKKILNLVNDATA